MRRTPQRGRPIKTQAALLSATLVTAACSSAELVTQCQADTDSSIVVAGDNNAVWRSPVAFKELWRVGGLSDSQQLVYPAGAVAAVDGRLAVTDFQLAEVVVVDADGTWLGPWGGRGQGPGELSAPVASNWSSTSDELATFDIGNARVLFFRNGAQSKPDIAVEPRLIAPILASGQLLWAGVQPSGGILVRPVAAIERDNPGKGQLVVLHVPPGARTADTLAAASVPLVGGPRPYGQLVAPEWPSPIAAVGTDGRIALGGMDSRYRVIVLNAEADTELVICRTIYSTATSGAVDMPKSIDEDLSSALASAPRPLVAAPYGRLFLGSRGRLWVQRMVASPLGAREQLLGVPGSPYDVFSPSGEYLGEVQAPADARLQAATGDTVWSFEVGELDEVWVVAYELSH